MIGGRVFVRRTVPHHTASYLAGLGGRIITIVIVISSLCAFRRARDGEAKGGADWQRSRWLDAKFEVRGGKCDLRQQQREKREVSG